MTDYTATDLFKLRTTLTLLTALDNKLDESFVSECYEKFNTDERLSRNMSALLFNHLKDYRDKFLPGLTKNKLKMICQNYHRKEERRQQLKIDVYFCYPKNRLMPLSAEFYKEFSQRSRNHFKIVMGAYFAHSKRIKNEWVTRMEYLDAKGRGVMLKRRENIKKCYICHREVGVSSPNDYFYLTDGVYRHVDCYIGSPNWFKYENQSKFNDLFKGGELNDRG